METIKNEEEYQELLKRLKELEKLNPEEHTLEGEELESLCFVVGEYEDKNCRLPEPTLKDHIQYALEQYGLAIKVEMKGYKSTIQHNVVDNAYYGKLEDVDDLILFEGQTIDEAVIAFIDAIEDYKELKKEAGKE